MSRTIAIGDIHGDSHALASLLDAIHPRHDDTIITIGDYMDRGIDSKGVLELLIDLSRRCRLISILGNHDEMMLKARESRSAFSEWMEFGGITTLASYGEAERLSLIPEKHFEFLESCLPFFETETHFFVHANYEAEKPLEKQTGQALRWMSLDCLPGPHASGKVAVVGHTPQPCVFDLGYLVCIDTGAGAGGHLTAVEMGTGEIWSVSG